MTSSVSTLEPADFGLAWEVKESFVSYIQGSRDGRIEVSDGAAVTSGGQFYFPIKGISGTDSGHRIVCGGKVRFNAHHGLLSIVLQSPRLLLEENSAELAVSDQKGGWLHLVHLDLPQPAQDGPALMWTSTQAALAASGVELFGDTYPTGETMAPVTLRVPSRAFMKTQSSH